MSPKNETQVGRVDGKCLYPLSQLVGPHFSEKNIFSSKHKTHLSSQNTRLWGRKDAGGYAMREMLDAASHWAGWRMQGAGGYATSEAAYCPIILLAFSAAVNLNVGPLMTGSKPSL